MTQTDIAQTEIPVPPPAGRLKKLRGLLPAADFIIRRCRQEDEFGVWEEPGGYRSFGPSHPAMKDLRARTRHLRKRLDALGIPLLLVGAPSQFPSGTEEIARAETCVWVALEIAMSAITAVMQAEKAVAALAGPGA